MIDVLLSLAYDLGKFLVPRAKELFEQDTDEFLNYDPAFLLNEYTSEHPISTGIPYSQIAKWIEPPLNSLEIADKHISIEVIPKEFQLDSSKGKWSSVQNEGFSAFIKSGRVKSNEPLIRLAEIYEDDTKIILRVQQVRYYDQVKSNLILDWRPVTDSGTGQVTLRTLLTHEYGDKLPPLSDKHLASPVGLASIVFYKENNRLVPYLIRRVTKVSVYPGGVHNTASGVAKWPDLHQGISFSNFFLNRIYWELEEEVGLTKNDFVEFAPVGLCREFLRAGKPQLFFIGITHLSREELAIRRKKAISLIEATNSWPEVERDTWMNSSDIIIPADRLIENIKKQGITFETVGAYFYCMKYFEAHEHRLRKLFTK